MTKGLGSGTPGSEVESLCFITMGLGTGFAAALPFAFAATFEPEGLADVLADAADSLCGAGASSFAETFCASTEVLFGEVGCAA